MKISFIEPHLKIYGGIRRIIEFANRLTERGHDVTIFHSDGRPCNWMKCMAKVKPYDEVLEENHDVLIYNDPNSIDYYLVKKAKAKLKIFYVLALYERDLLKGVNLKIYLPLPWNKRMLLLKKSLKSSYLKLSNSTWIYNWLKENMSISSELLIGGVNTDVFRPVEVEKNHNEIRILCSGDPRKRKGTSAILEAIKIVKSVEPRVVLDTYHDKGIPQEKMAEKYSSADIFVDGQWCAGWNNPVAEAMACKVPVVCTDIGGVQDFAFHEKTALLVTPKDPKAMASAIVGLIRDKELRESLRENAYQLIKKFDWDKSVDRLEEILTTKLDTVGPFSAFVASKDNAREVILEDISKVLSVSYTIAYLILKAGYNVGYAILNLIKGRKSHINFKEDMCSIPASIRFQTKKTQQSIHDAVNYILQYKEFNLCLDAGCAGNQYRQMLLKRCKMVVGVDLDPVETSDTYKMDILNLDFKNNTFDLVFSNQVIEHVYPREYFKFFSELLRVCKPGGEILVLTPNQFAPTRVLEGNFINYLDVDHKKEFNYFYARKIKKQVEQKFDCKVKIYGYSSFDSDHAYLIRLWSYLPMLFRKIPIKFPLFGRGIVFDIRKFSEASEIKNV